MCRAGMAGDLGYHHAVAVVVEIDLGDTGQGKIEPRAEYIIGDVHNAAEDGQARTVVGEQGDAAGGVPNDVVAVILPVVAQTLLLQPRVHGGVDAMDACLVARVGKIGVGVPLVAQGGHLGGDELADGGGHLQDPLLFPFAVQCVEVLEGIHLVGPIAEDGLLAQQAAGGHGRLHGTVGGGGKDLLGRTVQEPLGQRLGLGVTQGGQAVGIVDGLAVADEIQFHSGHSFARFFHCTKFCGRLQCFFVPLRMKSRVFSAFFAEILQEKRGREEKGRRGIFLSLLTDKETKKTAIVPKKS